MSLASFRTQRQQLMMGFLATLLLPLLLGGIRTATAFSPSRTVRTTSTIRPTTHGAVASSNTALYVAPLVSSSLSSSSSFNLFKRLPWNAQKEREREARRLKQERNTLHRELGIAEDATYEEIVQATDNLIQAAGNDLKAKVKIEVAKDKILQIRLNERMAGLTTLTKEARAQSSFEQDGADDTLESSKSKADDEDEMTGPKWTQGLIVKPDQKRWSYQIKLWGVLTAIGVGLPPVQGYMGKFNWLICVAQLIYRGMPAEERERGGMGLSFSSGGGSGGGHKKLSFALGLGIWAVSSVVIYGLMPSWVKGQRWEGSMVYTLQNLTFLLASCYLQPYKGGK